MNPLKLTLLLITGLLFNGQFAFSQKFLEMMDDPNANFFDVQKEANLYFKTFLTKEKLEKEKKAGNKNEKEGGLYNVYKRWEANMQHYIDEKGNRISTIQIDQAREKFKLENNSAQNKVQAQTWKELGPWDWKYTSGWNPGIGRLETIRIDAKDQNNIYVGSPNAGAWKTTNGGASWAPLTDFINSSALSVWGIGMADGSPDTVYIGNGAGIFYSYDGGKTLTNVFIANSTTVRRIEVNPNNHLIVLAATTAGIFRSTNAGKTWASVRTGAFYDLKFKPNDPNTVYAVGTSFAKSTDGGLTFNDVSMGSGKTKRLAVTTANPNYVYVAELAASTTQNIYRSSDAGTTFQTRIVGSLANGTAFGGYEPDGSGTQGQGSYNFCFTASQTDPEEIHLGFILTWKSTNGGTSFVATTEWEYPNTRGYSHCDMHCLEYVGSTLYTGSDGGIFKSNDKGDNFTNISQGLGIRMFYRLGLSKTDPS